MKPESLEQAIQRVGNAVEFLRNSQYPAFDFPVKSEWSNWRSEQMAWREACLILDQSHHMSNLFISGPDAFRFLSEYFVNSFANFKYGVAKQCISVNSDGYFVGDGVLFCLGDQSYNVVANASIVNWLQYHFERGKYNAKLEREDNSHQREGAPRQYRYELQGPNALALVEKVTGGPVPEVKFFHTVDFNIAGKKVTALRHGMAGQPGFEFYGPWADGDAVMQALLNTGKEFGLKRGGAKAYATANLESGWVPRPMAAIFGEKEKAFREWLPATAVGSLGGSMDSRNITDYYLTPSDLGYGAFVKFDHEFLGRAALEKLAANPRRNKVTLVWNNDDVMSAIRSHFEPGLPAKYIEFPKSRYAFFQVDKVMSKGRQVGMSTDAGYITNERMLISLATVDVELAKPGTEVTVVWGENPNSAKPTVEPHRQVEIRAIVAPCPIGQGTRASYRK